MSNSAQANGIGIARVTPIIEFDKLTDSITVYTGVVPFTFTLEVFLEQLQVQGVSTWYITLHLTGFGTDQVVFASNTVPVTLGVLTSVPFPFTAPPSVGSSAYDLMAFSNAGSTTGSQTDDAGPTSAFSVNVRVNAPAIAGGVPTVEVDNTGLSASWFIGARDIVITDPPIEFRKKQE